MERRIIFYTLFLAATTAIALSFAAVPVTWESSGAAFHFQLVASAITAVLHMGACTLFLVSLGAYKTQLRKAYIFISVGVVCVALGTLQLPILSWFDLWDSAWVNKGGIILPFLLAGVSLYAGARLFGRLVNAKTILTKASVVVPGIIVLTALASFLPHPAKTVSEMELDISNAVIVLDALFMFAGAMIVLRIKNQIGEHYVNAMAWLFAALFGAVIILLSAFLDTLFTSTDQDLSNHIITLLAAGFGLVWLRAGYAFAKAKEF